MELEPTVKGTIGQAIVKAILTSAGYRVVPFGVEETLREISVLSEAKYRQLSLPPVLRRMPDFVVATKKLDEVTLVEVKYRSNWSDDVRSGLFRSLQQQVKIWPNITLVVVFRAFKKRDAAIRCLRLTSNATREWYLEVDHEGKEINWNCVTQDHFLQLGEVFPKVSTFDSVLTAILNGMIGR